jgi:hypothetical protein
MDSSHCINNGPGPIVWIVSVVVSNSPDDDDDDDDSNTLVSEPHGPTLMPVSGLRGGGHTHRECAWTNVVVLVDCNNCNCCGQKLL